MSLEIITLQSGGLISNYYCSSKCRHCLYRCSPAWSRKFITEDDASKVFKTVKKFGCYSIHLGGGEPFLDPRSLVKIADAAAVEDISIDYIETNSSWYKDPESAGEILKELKKSGINTILVSISPFHNEYIPFSRVKGVIKACEDRGLTVFPWVADFYREIDSFDDSRPHPVEEYAEKFGSSFIKNIPSRYWIHYGGRSLNFFKESFILRELDEILSSGRCRELEDTSHFHIDLFGNYIPGLCSGISINLEDLGRPLDTGKYPIISSLHSTGVKGLLDIAEKDFGFTPADKYRSKCHLCYEIRKFLAVEKKLDSLELKPDEFYLDINE